MTSSESDTSFSGRVPGRPKRSLRVKTLSWSDHVDKITYASDGESLLAEDRVAEKTPLAEENDKNKKGSNCKRLRGTPMEGFQIMTVDDLNGTDTGSDTQVLVQDIEEAEDEEDNLPSVGTAVPNAKNTNSESITASAIRTDKDDNGNKLVTKKRPVPAPRASVKHGDIANNNLSDANKNNQGDINNKSDQNILPKVPQKLSVGSTEQPVSRLPEVNAHGGQQLGTIDQTGYDKDYKNSVEQRREVGAANAGDIPNSSHTFSSIPEKKELKQSENKLESDNTYDGDVKLSVSGSNKSANSPQVHYTAKPRQVPNPNSKETDIDEVTPLMTETQSSDSPVQPQIQNYSIRQPGPNELPRGPIPPHMLRPMYRFPPGQMPMRPLFPQHFHPAQRMRPPMGPFPPHFPQDPNFRYPSPDQMNQSPPQSGSPYSWQSDPRDSPMNMSGPPGPGFPPGMAPGPYPPMGQFMRPPLQFSTGSSPVPSDLTEPQYFDHDGREYPEGHPMLYPQYEPGAPSTMTGITGLSMAPSMAGLGSSVMQEPNPHLFLSCISLLLGNWIFGPVALAFSLSSRSSIKKGELARAAMKGRVALILNIIGIIVTVLFVILLASMASMGTLG